jgi:D-3-phosphoglycerate dehydrogenase
MIQQISNLEEVLFNYNFKLKVPLLEQNLDVKELLKNLRGVDAWIVGDDQVTNKVLHYCKNLGVQEIIKWGVGTDNIDFESASRYGYKIKNTPGVFSKDVSELAIGFLLNLVRNISKVDTEIRYGKWPKLIGRRIEELTIGIVGMGAIGKHLNFLLMTMGAKTIIYDPYLVTQKQNSFKSQDWPDRTEQLDFIIFCCPLTEETEYMLNMSTINLLKKGVGIINVARGKIIDENALIFGLESEIVSCAALDVFEIEPVPLHSKLREFTNVILSSHNASNTFQGGLSTSMAVLTYLKEKLR